MALLGVGGSSCKRQTRELCRFYNGNGSRGSLNAPDRGGSLASDDLAAAAADVDRQTAGGSGAGLLVFYCFLLDQFILARI